MCISAIKTLIHNDQYLQSRDEIEFGPIKSK